MGETVACATVSQCLYILSYMHKYNVTRLSDSCITATGILMMEFVNILKITVARSNPDVGSEHSKELIRC